MGWRHKIGNASDRRKFQSNFGEGAHGANQRLFDRFICVFSTCVLHAFAAIWEHFRDPSCKTLGQMCASTKDLHEKTMFR